MFTKHRSFNSFKLLHNLTPNQSIFVQFCFILVPNNQRLHNESFEISIFTNSIDSTQPLSHVHLSLRCLILYIYILYTSVRFIANFCKTKKFRNLSADFKDSKLLNSILIIHLICFTDAL